MRSFVRMVPVIAIMALLPSLALAQGTLTGVVRDASGGVLPGVTVEAASPALTEKVRTAVTDGSGQYRLIDLTPGTYSLTVTLPGFSTVKREGIVLAGSATVAIPIELRVGGLEETITVTGETPVVDVQSVRRETVLSSDTISAIPATRTVGSLLNATPGLTVDNNGVAVTPTMTFFSARGGQTNEGRMAVNGMTVAATFNGGGVSSYILDTANVDEVSVVVSGGLGETDVGAPTMNLVPKGGGNSFSGQAFINEAGDWSRSSNIDDELRAVGLSDPPGIIKSYDGSVSYGGPIKRDKLWFFGSYRKLNTETNVEGIVANANAYDLGKWLWAPDNSVKARQSQGRTMYIGRITAQPTPKHRFSFNHEYQLRCEGSPLKVETTEACHTRSADWIAAGAATMSPEAHTPYFDMPYYVTQATWSAPMTSKLLLESGYTRFSYYHAGGPGQLPPDGIFNIGVTEQSTVPNAANGYTTPVPRANYVYRALSNYADNYGQSNNWRASASYVTGAHSLKVGYQGQLLRNDTTAKVNPSGLSYTFNQGVPVSFTMRLPEWQNAERTATSSAFVQDTWTRGRVTVQGALRFDRAWSWSPADGNGTTATSPTNLAPIAFDRTPSVDAFNDITPRFGVAWDVFGNGTTALKFNGGHYLDAATNDSAFTRNNPASAFNAATGTGRTVIQVTRNWSDTDGDRVVDCDLLNFAAQSSGDTCAALTGDNLNFGRSGSNLTQINQDTLRGWGVRENDWQYGVTLQQQIVPRVSVEVGYAHRSFYGFTVTDNTVRNPSQYDAWTITAPTDSRLPGGGGYPITMYTPTAAAAALAARNYITFESDFGAKRKSYYDGVDLTLNGRLRQGLTFQIGTQTGRSVLDTCAIDTKVDTPDPRFCRNDAPFLTTVRGLASYTLPKVDVQVSATFRSQPATELGIADTSVGPTANGATWNVPNTVVQGLLGRLPPGALATGTTPVRLLDGENRLFVGGRRNQVDMRIAKIIRFGRTRLDAGLDLNNLFNTNYATAYQSTYQYGAANGGTWLNPTSVYTPRYVRLNLTASF
jgi:hypothetical protein